jgi:hypothetical protein
MVHITNECLIYLFHKKIYLSTFIIVSFICTDYMASNDDDESSSNFFTDNLERNDIERDLYAILHISKDV